MPEDGAAGNWSDLSPIAYTQRDVLLCEYLGAPARGERFWLH